MANVFKYIERDHDLTYSHTTRFNIMLFKGPWENTMLIVYISYCLIDLGIAYSVRN